MKNIIIILLVACLGSNVRAQFSGDVSLISSGGGLVSGNGYSGSATIGLPLVGIVSNNTYGLKIGLYGSHDTTKPSQGVIEQPLLHIFKLYPNPTSGDINLIMPAAFGKVQQISLFDEAGDDLAKISFQEDGDKIKLKVNNKPNGIYFLRIESRNSATNYKVTLLK